MKNFATKQIKNIKKFNSTRFSQDEDDDEQHVQSNKLGFFRSVQQCEKLDIHITGDIVNADYYTSVVQAIKNTDEGDEIHLHLNSWGGSLNGLQSILSAIYSTEAVTIAYLDGAIFSACGILALHCDNIHVSPFAEFMVHFVSFATGGRSSDVVSHVEFVKRNSEKLFRDTYKNFLTPEEIEQCIHNGKEIWLDSEQIIERLQNKFAILQAEEAEECNGDCQGCMCHEVEGEVAEPEVKVSKPKRSKS